MASARLHSEADQVYSGIQTLAWGASYAVAQAAILAAAACATAFAGQAPWALHISGGWMAVAARILLWSTLSSGLSELVGGEWAKFLPTWKHAAGLCCSWTAALAAQLVCTSLEAVPSRAAFGVGAGVTLVHALVHGALCGTKEWPSSVVSCSFRIQNAVRWALQGLLLALTAQLPDANNLPLLLAWTIVAQAAWQAHAWFNGVQASLMQVHSLHVSALLLSHIVSVWATLAASQLGSAHAAVVMYALYALSVVAYEPRLALPFRAEEVNMRIWCVVWLPCPMCDCAGVCAACCAALLCCMLQQADLY